jgi:DNA-binding FrmR family transcriptional regulator
VHTIEQRAKLITRVRRIQGQLAAVERALEQELSCGETLRRVAAARGALDGLLSELIVEHVDNHVRDERVGSKRRRAIVELKRVIRTYAR